MRKIPDFGESEINYVCDALRGRFEEPVELHLADAQLRLDAGSEALTECPAVFWQARDCSFVLLKTGDGEYRCRFFYGPTEQFGTGHTSYHDLPQAVMAMLQVQADHERERLGVRSGSTGEDLT